MSVDAIAADAFAAAEAKDFELARRLYEQLESLEPDEPEWSKKIAGIHRRRGDMKSRIAALVRAADKHHRRGQPMKGLATLKIARELAPEDLDVRASLSRVRHADPKTPRSRNDSYVRPATGEHQLAVIPLIRRARTNAEYDGAIVEVNAAVFDPRSSDEPLDLELEILPPIPLFSSLSEEAFARLLDASETVHFRAGQTVFSRGDPGDALFVVVDGAVDVHLERPTARLESGTFFGEMSLFTGRPRNATLVAAEDTELIRFSHAQIIELVQGEPPVLEILIQFFRQRLVENVLRAAPALSDLPEDTKDALRRSFRLLDIKATSEITRQGRPSPGLFLVIDGSFTVEHVDEFGDRRTVATLGVGEVFGEISVVTEHPATATVSAQTDALVLAVDRPTFAALALDHPALVQSFTSLAGRRLAALGYPQ